MRIQTFNNNKGLIYGSDVYRMSCDKEGILKIGNTEISISPESESVVPALVNGGTGLYKAVFTDSSGNVYELEKVTIKGGRIVPPPETAVDIMELQCRADALEKKCETLTEQVFELSKIFDTNSLNFIIK